jgi:hypothetical protein
MKYSNKPQYNRRKRQREGNKMLDAIKNFNKERVSMDELLLLSVMAGQLKTAYEGNKLPVPAWLTENSKAISIEVKSRRTDELLRLHKAAKHRVETLKTTDEKRADANNEAARIAAELAELGVTA